MNVEKGALPEREVYPETHGEYPPGIAEIPGTIPIDYVAGNKGLREKASGLLEKRPHILAFARKSGKDLFAMSTARGKVFVIGAGVAVLTVGVAGIIYFQHKNEGSEDVELDS